MAKCGAIEDVEKIFSPFLRVSRFFPIFVLEPGKVHSLCFV